MISRVNNNNLGNNFENNLWNLEHYAKIARNSEQNNVNNYEHNYLSPNQLYTHM